ncbi:MAG TPA: cytochrome c3 family protein [Kofleriaceae bacterium]|jgi:predicted CXXCH cytochrome family protein
MKRWVLLALVACHASAPSAPPVVQSSGPIASNVLRKDYAGSRACADCHDAIYKSWEVSPMRNMTRDARVAQIRAPFDGAQLRVGDDVVTMTMAGSDRVMQLVSPKGNHTFRVTKVVGGRYREDFVGVETDGVEHVLPATYVFSTKSWRYKGYSVMVTERPWMSWQGVWSQECIGCHNTLPLATMLYDDLYGPSLPPYQGKMQDRVLPESRKWPAHATDVTGLEHALADEIRFMNGTVPLGSLNNLLPAAATTMEKKLDGDHLVELGIGCEACHNGAAAHAAEPKVIPQFAARSGVLEVDPPRGEAGTKAQWINHTCAKCHTVLFTRYPFTWEDGLRRKNPGGSSISSGEGRDYQLGGCSSQMACTTCHDPHTEDPKAKLAELGTPAGNHICVTCHAQYASDDALAKHSHHQIGGAGTACIACHMAKKNMGLDYVLNRYHRIGSPDDPTRVEGDRPVECALCHADKTVESLVTTMESWWGKHYDRRKLARLYGDDLNVNAMRATLSLGKAHEQAVAIATWGALKQQDAVSAIAPMLAHEYPLVRYFAQRALQQITGDPVAIDVGAPAAIVRAQADAWLKAREAHP